ncbi:MAG: T9SS type A sorting domain-containing protein [Bacteroidales bacterium]|nr:T9SS type A sorting domain-containing protein [Bacteroidales bacterium]MCF8402717.1 T9SS type A sorting domain-containing protein [Bacteroidales bacterium]
MKNLIILLSIFVITTTTISQERISINKSLRNKFLKHQPSTNSHEGISASTIPYKSGNTFTQEDLIGVTRYDNQSNASIPKKMYLYDDGTMAATWTMSMDENSFFADRGTGYNYFDGSSWGAYPSARVEDIKVHRPAYAPLGENGELIVSHTSGTGLYFASREEKGTGEWDYSEFPGPAGNGYLVWNRVVTSGTDRNRIHLLALTLPSSHGGLPYEDLDGALLYSLSTDGGSTWFKQNEVLDGISSDEYTGFAGDTYAFAEPKDDIVAFVVGDPWTGLALMKSEDGGENFDKTTIWEHPYPMWSWGTPTDTFYCADGSQSAVIDDEGKVHVAFGINRVMAEDNSTFWYPFVGGIAYWNEDMPAFSNNVNALNPYGHPDSELITDYNLIGWSQDVNNNGQLDLLDEIGLYYIGLSSMPQLVFTDEGSLILVYSSVTETYDNGLQNYRHIWARGSVDGGTTWGSFDLLTSDLVHIFDECVYPACAAHTDGNLYLVYQYDGSPGTAVWSSQHPYLDNTISVLTYPYYSTDVNEETSITHKIEVSQNYPNPSSGETSIHVKLQSAVTLDLKVINSTGQKVIEQKGMNGHPGMNKITFDLSGLTRGIYFYTVSSGETEVTMKLVVE